MKYYNKEWYNNGCRPIEKNKEYIDYMNKYLPKWYKDISLHDSEILNVKECNDLITFNLIYDDYIHTKYQLRFYNPKIIETCRLVGTWCVSDEIYVNDESCEFHLMVDWSEDGEPKPILGYFTVECTKIELFMNNKLYEIKSGDISIS